MCDVSCGLGFIVFFLELPFSASTLPCTIPSHVRTYCLFSYYELEHSSSSASSFAMEQQLKAPPEIKKVAQFLRGGSSGMKVRVGAMNGKRLDYFKGSDGALPPDFHQHHFFRKICRQGPPLTRVFQVVQCAQSRDRGRCGKSVERRQHVRLFSSRTTRWSLGNIIILSEKPSSHSRTKI